MLKIGTDVYRVIDNMHFPAVIHDVQTKRGVMTYTIKYLDDGNIEDSVSPSEISLRNRESKESNIIENHSIGDTLKKPLAGLIEDDSKDRRNHVPTVLIHNNIETGKYTIYISTAFIRNHHILLF